MLEGSKAGAVLREGGTFEELAFGFVDRSDGYPDALWGSTPIKTFMSACTSVSVGALPLAREGHSDFGSSAPIPLSSHSAPGTGGTQA